MTGQNINNQQKKLTVLISPLDWGLGHATRIVTIIKILQKHGTQVLIAAEGAAAALLQSEFPQVEILDFPGYRVHYSKHKKNFIWVLLRQIPGIAGTIRAENNWLKKVVKEHNIDAIISDNRFGFYHKSIPSVYITHQLFIETGKKWMNAIAQKIHYKYINRFNECWVPDFEKEQNLAGKLSHPSAKPAIDIKFIGPLSRFKKAEEKNISNNVVIILSGPEPQRTIWEKQLLKQIENYTGSVILVRGKPGSRDEISGNLNLKVYNHLPAAELGNLIESAAVVLSRSGYSTVMDLVALGKKAILVPTPGQAEQEYLAVYLKEKKFFYTCSQQELQLDNAIKMAAEFPQQQLLVDFETMNERVITEWLERLREAK